MLRSEKKYNLSVIIGFGLLIIGFIIITYNYFDTKKFEVFDKMNIALLNSETPSNIDDDNDIPQEDVEDPDGDPSSTDNPSTENPKPRPKPIDYSKYYVGTLEIPKINLKKGFLDIDSPYNNINRNVTVIQTSTYPDVEGGNFILAAHTGNSSVGFFTRLHDLSIGDLAYITYKQKKYTYELVNIYTQPKTGSVAIYRDPDKTTLTLVTCTKNSLDSQTIFILELKNVE